MKTLNELTQERYDLITDIIELRRKIKIKENKLEQNFMKIQKIRIAYNSQMEDIIHFE